MYTSIEVRMERKEKVSKAQTCVAMTAPDEETFIAVSVAAIDHSRRKQNFGGIFEFPWRIRSQSGHVPSEMSHWTKLRVRELIMNQRLHFQNVIPITQANSDIFQHYVIIKPTNDGFPLAEIVDIQRLRCSCGFLRYFHAVARFIIGRENGETVRIVLSSPAEKEKQKNYSTWPVSNPRHQKTVQPLRRLSHRAIEVFLTDRTYLYLLMKTNFQKKINGAPLAQKIITVEVAIRCPFV